MATLVAASPIMAVALGPAVAMNLPSLVPGAKRPFLMAMAVNSEVTLCVSESICASPLSFVSDRERKLVTPLLFSSSVRTWVAP